MRHAPADRKHKKQKKLVAPVVEKKVVLHSTAAALKEKQENPDHNIAKETGIFIMHVSSETYSKYKCNNMFLYNYTGILLAFMCLFLLHLTNSAVAVATIDSHVIRSAAPYRECSNLFVRGGCSRVIDYKNCTVITGSLSIARLSPDYCNITQLSFDNLREITDFLFMSSNSYIATTKTLFPKLTVIRGRRLFTNYALHLNKNADLTKIEFPSLIAIQRGSVLIADHTHLCNMEKINWERLTLKPGKNNIFKAKTSNCTEEGVRCAGCSTDSCWSSEVCQKFESDSVAYSMNHTVKCHNQCLGGCFGATASDCVVCKGYTDHGTCVEKCPADKYISSHYLRCYTREECHTKGLYVYDNKCVDFCPVGYKENNEMMQCVSCGSIKKCLRLCSSKNRYDSTIYIKDIETAQSLRGCQIFNNSVHLDIYEIIDHNELVDALRNLREIRGYLKITRSNHFNNLNFFQNLEKIHGLELEHNVYSLIIYNNKNATSLWTPKKRFELVNGGMYIHGNDKLCNRFINVFRRNVIHDSRLDFLQKTDRFVFCLPSKLYVKVENISHHYVTLSWSRYETLSQVEILYRPLRDKETVEDDSELYAEVCQKINWRKDLKFADELAIQRNRYFYSIENLEPHTSYGIVVKTFNGKDDNKDSRSEVKYITTRYDLPPPPEIILKDRTSEELLIEFSPGKVGSDRILPVSNYILAVYHIPDDKKLLDTRDYCDEPIMGFKEKINEDYEECCSRREQERRDQTFMSQLKKELSCSKDRSAYCGYNNDLPEVKGGNLILSKNILGWEKQYTVKSLLNYNLYALQLRACNSEGCSSYSMLSARTNYSLAADKISNITFCRENKTNEYRVHFFEPEQPNGYITSYALHFRNHTLIDNEPIIAQNTLVCVTRLEHERNQFVYSVHSNFTFNQASIRIYSLGHHTIMNWENITECLGDLSAAASGGNHIVIVILIACIVITPISIIMYFLSRYIMRYCRRRVAFLPRSSSWRYERHQPLGRNRQILIRALEFRFFQRRPEDIELQPMNYHQ